MQERANSLTAQIEDIRQQFTAAEPFLSLVETTLTAPLPDIDAAALIEELNGFDQRQQSISTKLRAAKTAVEHIEGMSSGAEKERANNAIGAINALMKAFDAGKDILEDAISAARIYDQAESFLTDTMEGDSLAREAAATDLVDAAAAEAAIQKSDEAIAKFVQARDALRAVQNEGSWLIDSSEAFEQSANDLLKPFEDYATLRITAQEHAKETDEARINLASQAMVEANAQYNAAEEEAAQLIAGKRDQYPTDIVRKAYETTLQKNETVASWQSEYAKTTSLLDQL